LFVLVFFFSSRRRRTRSSRVSGARRCLKLIALEPITLGEIHAVCGWPAVDVDKALDELLRAGLVTFKHYGFHRWYVAK